MLVNIRRCAIPALILSSLCAAASAQTLSFRQGVNGYTGTQDTMVRSNLTSPGQGQNPVTGAQDTNYGSLTLMGVDGDDGEPGLRPNHVLIRFDGMFGSGPNQIRAADSIVSATLRLDVFNEGSGFTVHDLLTDWAQGTVTWNSLNNGVSANGVEAGLAAIAAFGANNSSPNVVTGVLLIDVTSSLRAVQSGSLPGFGWALLPFVNGVNGIDFHTSEAAVGLRPELVVATIPEPAQYALMGAGLAIVGLVSRRRRPPQAGQ